MQELLKNNVDTLIDEYNNLYNSINDEQKRIRLISVYKNEYDETIRRDKEKKELLEKSMTLFVKIFKRREYKSIKMELEEIEKHITYTNNASLKCDRELLSLNKESKDNLAKLKEIKSSLNGIIDNKLEQAKHEVRSEIKNIDGYLVVDGNTQSDLYKSCIGLDFDKKSFSIKDLALVHATNYAPKDGIIKSSSDGKKKDNEGNYLHRNTVHFALNGKVSDHVMGSWQDVKYVIIEPASNQIKNISTMRPSDTYAFGSINLSKDAIVLVNEKLFNKEDEQDLKGLNVIKYSGDSKVAVDKVLLALGYLPQEILKYSWENENNNVTQDEYQKKNYPNINNDIHYYSDAMKSEEILRHRDSVINKLRGQEIYTNDGITITGEEVQKLFEKYKKLQESENNDGLNKNSITDFVLKFGIRFDIKTNNFYLLSDNKYIERLKYNFNDKVNDVDIVTIEAVMNALEGIFDYKYSSSHISR